MASLHLRRLRHALDNHGLVGLLRRVGQRGRAQHPDPSDFDASNAPEQVQHPFDRAHHVDTGGYTPGAHLAQATPSGFYTTAYYGISPSTLRAALSAVPEPLDSFTFVDLGCGKGRALLVAAEFPFARIVGVELDPKLAEVARINVTRLPGARGRVEVTTGDATGFHFPPGPLVIFLYHPFLAPVLNRTLHNLEQQLLAGRRPVYLLRANPGYPRVMARQWFLRRLWSRDLPLSAEDAAADRHGITAERYDLWQADL